VAGGGGGGGGGGIEFSEQGLWGSCFGALLGQQQSGA
jgi:hypothetical protein